MVIVVVEDRIEKFCGLEQCPPLFLAILVWQGVPGGLGVWQILQDGQCLECSPGWDSCSWLDNYRALKLSPGGVRVFLGGSCVLLDSVCPFLCGSEPDARMCFQGAGNVAFGNRGLG